MKRISRLALPEVLEVGIAPHPHPILIIIIIKIIVKII